MAKKKKIYCIDVHWDVARSFEIEAGSRQEAELEMWNRIENGNVCVWNDGFEATDDIEVECHGETNSKGEMEYD